MNMRQYTFVDLFAGAGGFSEGMLLAGGRERRFSLTAASDISPVAQLTHRHRYASNLGIDYEFLVADMASTAFPELLAHAASRVARASTVDVVVGGPPCQGFSVFGSRNESDPRNDLFVAYLRVIERLRPKYFVMENVPGMATMYNGKAVARIFSSVPRDAADKIRDERSA